MTLSFNFFPSGKTGATTECSEVHRQGDGHKIRNNQMPPRTRITNEKRELIKNTDRETRRKLVGSCEHQLRAIRSKSVFGTNFPHYSPDNLEKFAGGAGYFKIPLGWPSVALDNYDFDSTA